MEQCSEERDEELIVLSSVYESENVNVIDISGSFEGHLVFPRQIEITLFGTNGKEKLGVFQVKKSLGRNEFLCSYQCRLFFLLVIHCFNRRLLFFAIGAKRNNEPQWKVERWIPKRCWISTDHWLK